MSDTKIQTIQGIYEAFGRGDVDAILDKVTDDVDWAVEPDGSAPWNGVRRGRSEVSNFFKALADNVEVTEFTPLAFASNDTDVMVVIRYGARVPATGKSGAMDLHHWWRFRDDKDLLRSGHRRHGPDHQPPVGWLTPSTSSWYYPSPTSGSIGV